ncbi:unnamed protein product [Lactuca saligna]|uniref:EndoU domain-containing protein n=1 Tax=Lactuca saligna TaxID=75948 RepID=A0AA35VJH1_LACSI|nr:unnamed protein product [Lactuca saligna]
MSELQIVNGYNQRHPGQKTEEENNDGWETVGKKPARKHQQLWELDYNSLTPGNDYEIDCGEGKKAYQNQDMAEGSLVNWLSEDVLKKPTISRFYSPLDNYSSHEGYTEQVTSQEKQEQLGFIEEIYRIAHIIYLFKYLWAKGIVSHDYAEFKGLLTSLWFDLYGRGCTSSCSSTFEHVFVGEIKSRGEQSVSGFHKLAGNSRFRASVIGYRHSQSDVIFTVKENETQELDLEDIHKAKKHMIKLTQSSTVRNQKELIISWAKSLDMNSKQITRIGLHNLD